jgi:four helix bundle protein
MATVLKFEDLEIGQKARLHNKKFYPLTFIELISKNFRFKDQLRGSCGSIMDNIAEGFERSSKLGFINSLTIAKGETGKLKSQLYRGIDNHYLSIDQFEELYALAGEITKMIASFVNYLNKAIVKGQKFKDRN